jgi:HEXXH motif-containing protein
MDEIERATRAFSCPEEPFDTDFMAFIISTHAADSVMRFLAAFGSAVEEHSNGLRQFLSKEVKKGIAADAAWDSSFSYIFRVVQGTNKSSPILLAAAAGVRLNAFGAVGTWTADWQYPMAQLRWGQWLLPAANGLSVSSDGNQATVIIRGQQLTRTITFHRIRDGWESLDCERLQTLASPATPITLLPLHALAAHEATELKPLISSANIPHEVKKAYDEASKLIADSAAIYLPWFSRAIRSIAVVEPPSKDMMASGTAEWSCGFIHISLCTKVIALAETLVHEASHQYFHIASRLGSVDDGTDKNSYYSPVVRAQRPLSRILLAYHAFANVLIFYRMLAVAGAFNEYPAPNMTEIENQVEMLATPLRNNPALTSIGRSLFVPLDERVGQKEEIHAD